GLQALAHIPPADTHAKLREVARDDLGGHQLAIAHHHRTRALGELLRQVDALRERAHLVEVTLQLRADADAQFLAELLMARDDALQHLFVFAGQQIGRASRRDSVTTPPYAGAGRAR